MSDLKAPFPYFGGKRRVARVVWDALGQPAHYIEPCFGSGAVLLARPGYDPTAHTETVCDADGHVANVWRSLQFAADEVARWADWPVNHIDLVARKKEMIKNEEQLVEHLIADPGWYDPVMAGYWIWAASCWIGSGMTSVRQTPNIGHGGEGIHSKSLHENIGKIPRVSRGGAGVHAAGQVPLISLSGGGVHAVGQIPHISGGGRGVHGRPPGSVDDPQLDEPYNTGVYRWFRRLAERLRYVRVVCGDWSSVCGGNWQTAMGVCGIFFDPPYGAADRLDVYAQEDYAAAREIEDWAAARGGLPAYRIVLAGYEDEHTALDARGWTVHRWSAMGGYGNTGVDAESRGKTNRHRETLWFSPHCLKTDLFSNLKGGN